MLDRDDKKTDILQELIAEWTGEVGQLNAAVQKMPGAFKASIAEIEADQLKILAKMEGYSTQLDQNIGSSFGFLKEQYATMGAKQQELKDLVTQNKKDNNINVVQIRSAVGGLVIPVAKISDAVEKIEGIIVRSNELNSNSHNLLGNIEGSVGASKDAIKLFNDEYREFTEKNQEIFEFIIQSAAVAKSEKERNENTRSGIREIDAAIDKLNLDYKIAAAAAAACFVFGFIFGKFL